MSDFRVHAAAEPLRRKIKTWAFKGVSTWTLMDVPIIGNLVAHLGR